LFPLYKFSILHGYAYLPVTLPVLLPQTCSPSLQQDDFAGVVLLAPLLSMQRTAGSWMGSGWQLLLPLLDRIWPTLPLGVSVHASQQPELVQDMYAGKHAA
jgi:hypothetical protein